MVEKMKKMRFTFYGGLVLFFVSCQVTALHAQQAEVWLTTADRSALFAKQSQKLSFGNSGSNNPVIRIDEKQTYQTIDGFGFCLTGGSAQHIMKMDKASRTALLKDIFGTNKNAIGVSYLRLSIGASDLNDRVFSYDDLPEGETDPEMKRFDLGQDKSDVIPVMKEILQINPSIKVLGSPWSPPVWMKTNNDTRGGRLKPGAYPAYAKYFVRYIQDMKKQGITIDAITVQNEPLHPGNNPSLLLPAPDEADFIKHHLGPAFKQAGIKTKIILYDHNCDRPDYPISILDDAEAKKYINGSGFHLYGGPITAMTDVHNAHPDRALYFTEQMVVQENDNTPLGVANPVRRLIIGATRNWSRNVLLWNLAADQENKPFTDRGGCSMCQGAVTIDGNKATNNIAYYVIAHASKFVRPGSVRIESAAADSLSNVAFKTLDGKKVLIVVNDANTAQTFSIEIKGKQAAAQLEAKAVATYVWE
jgi:glucosylceramidase